MTDLLVIGAGGFGREVAALLASHDRFGLLGFADDVLAEHSEVNGWGPILGPIASCVELAPAVIAIGDPTTRQRISEGSSFASAPWIAHASAWIGPMVRLGAGTVVCSGVSITTNVVIGNHVHVNLHSTIGHDASIGDFVTISPGVCISGSVEVGDRVQIGTGASVLPGVTIGADSVIGAGAVVNRPVRTGATVVGVPAREIPVD